MVNNTTHRPATIQRIRIGADHDGRITAIGHESWSGDQPGDSSERAMGVRVRGYPVTLDKLLDRLPEAA